MKETRQRTGYRGSSRAGGPPGLEESKPTSRSLAAFMPIRTEVKNSFKIFQVEEDEDDDDEAVEVNEVVELTVDSGASRSVWPRKKKGVMRTKICGRIPKVQAANRTNIEVEGEAMLEFEMGGKRYGMKFLDADVKKPLGAVSAMKDERNTVVFNKKWGRHVENDTTGERIPMVRKGGVYVMVLQAMDSKGNKVKKAKEEDDDVDVAGLSDEGNAEKANKGDTVVFRRRMLD